MAAELVGMGAQRLRMYESRGLLEPDRSAGGTRRYSHDDLDRLRRIDALLGAGLNLAGIAMVLDLQDENDRLHRRLHHQCDESSRDSDDDNTGHDTTDRDGRRQ